LDLAGHTKAAPLRPCVGEFRRIGMYGPVYEVIGIASAEKIIIRELESQRVTRDYLITHFQNDIPVA